MTLNELSNAWNDLRNAALGRGTRPAVSPALAERVGKSWEAFRVWLADAHVVPDEVFTSITARRWIELYRELVTLVRAEGQQIDPVTELETTPLEQASAAATGAAQGVASVARWVAAAAGLAVVGVATVLLVRGRR